MKNLKRSVITRGIGKVIINAAHNLTHTPQLGDVAVFEVVHIGKHTAVQGGDETLVKIFLGDQVLLAFGGRYASNQLEGYVPNAPTTELQILGQGGAVGVLASTHSQFRKAGATKLRLVGYAVDAKNRVLNTRYLRLDQADFSQVKKTNYDIYLSLGASMDSGKTTTAAHLARGAMLAGKQVAYIKLTGTAYSKDRRVVRDSGAALSVDFSHCGYPSTYMCSTEEILAIYATLLKRVESCNPDVVIVEIADGLLERETYALLQHEQFMQTISGVVLSCPDSLSVYGGLHILLSLDTTPIMLSGIFTASPLMIKEVENFTNIPSFALEDFLEKDQLMRVLEKYHKSNDL